MRPSTLDTRAGQTRCPSTPHRHVHGQMTCARCGVTDGTVAQTITASGERWPATCSACASKVARLSALRYVTEAAA
jgi:hypothetical protein